MKLSKLAFNKSTPKPTEDNQSLSNRVRTFFSSCIPSCNRSPVNLSTPSPTNIVMQSPSGNNALQSIQVFNPILFKKCKTFTDYQNIFSKFNEEDKKKISEKCNVSFK